MKPKSEGKKHLKTTIEVLLQEIADLKKDKKELEDKLYLTGKHVSDLQFANLMISAMVPVIIEQGREQKKEPNKENES